MRIRTPISVSNINGKFTCFKCFKKLISPTTPKRHLEKRRTGSRIKKNDCIPKVDSDNDNSNNNNSTFNAHDSNKSSDDDQSVVLSRNMMHPSHLILDERSSSSSSSVCDKKTSILLALSALSLSNSEQQIYGWRYCKKSVSIIFFYMMRK